MSAVERVLGIWLLLGIAGCGADGPPATGPAGSGDPAKSAGGSGGEAGQGKPVSASNPPQAGAKATTPPAATTAVATTAPALPATAAGSGAMAMTMAMAMPQAGAGASVPPVMPAAGSGGAMTTPGMCCPTGDCLCHGDVPSALTSEMGPFKTATLRVATGTIHYPMDAEPPFAAVAVCGGFLNTGPEMETWGDFYASFGIVTIITTTGASDPPDTRGDKLIAAVKSVKDENMKSDSPLNGKMSERYGTSGYSMGGGGTTIATSKDASITTSVGMAPFGGTGMNVKTATLLLCGSADTTAPCNMAMSVYMGITDPTPKMLVVLSGTSHLEWVGSYMTAGGAAAKIALAWQKVFLEGDERWKPLLKSMVMNVQSSMSANID